MTKTNTGGGKSARDGMGLKSGATHASGALDLVITNAIIIDPVQGVVKADIESATDSSPVSENPAIRT
ncbi:MAG: hypothetical protein R2848_11330 [Thermomicrobiales bacterium]